LQYKTLYTPRRCKRKNDEKSEYKRHEEKINLSHICQEDILTDIFLPTRTNPLAGPTRILKGSGTKVKSGKYVADLIYVHRLAPETFGL
jgi:hypothetical protein